jgi:hypothetical protein
MPWYALVYKVLIPFLFVLSPPPPQGKSGVPTYWLLSLLFYGMHFSSHVKAKNEFHILSITKTNSIFYRKQKRIPYFIDNKNEFHILSITSVFKKLCSSNLTGFNCINTYSTQNIKLYIVKSEELHEYCTY